MRSKQRTLAVAAACASVVLLVPLAPAFAGHTNTVLEADLTGRAEVGTSKAIAGDPNGRGEVYVNGIDGDPTTLCYVLTVGKIAPAQAAHIHKGAAGTNGPVVVNLAAPADGNAADCLTEGEAGKFVSGQTVADILANPEDYYVNVHNAEFPGGAIRGQLAAQH
jgi:hypothetical protein